MGVWFGLFKYMFFFNPVLTHFDKQLYRERRKDRYLKLFFAEGHNLKDMGAHNFGGSHQTHSSLAQIKREGPLYSGLLGCNENRVENGKYYKFSGGMPIVFEEEYSYEDGEASKSTESTRDEGDKQDSEELEEGEIPKDLGFIQTKKEVPKEKRLRIVFLCHGFQGSRLDMLKFKTYFGLERPDVLFFASRTNEEDTTRDIGAMGFSFSREVEGQVCLVHAQGTLESISFIGHSLGNLF